ncbi:uncharacterized protein LOC143920315 [Arctopsyche grandis]|uniref:uncharacterized protein LOC143920315 n=1 Tax=Arctopsyche grandis TaxID=121162 RepID=UPI00406D9B3C
MDRSWKLCCLGTLLALAGTVAAAPGLQSESFEAASLQLGALQAQAQYAPSALQGARAASRSAASCLVTAVQYTHGQQIRREDPCEFCLCLDGEMFCWWQECPPEAPGPCPSGQPYTLCGNSSSTLDQHTPQPQRKIKKTKKYKKATTTTKMMTTVLPTTYKTTMTTSNDGAAMTKTIEKKPSKSKTKDKSKYDGNKEEGNYTTAENSVYETQTMAFESDDRTKEDLLTEGVTSRDSGSSLNGTEASTAELSRTGCLVMGVEYQIGQALPSTGSCLVCRCSDGGSSGAKVSCAPRGCAPMDAAALTDDPESF